MANSFTSEDEQLQITIQQSLQTIAVQMGQPIDLEDAKQLYQEAVDLLSHLAYAPITLARVAGTLLVYQLQDIELEEGELDWFKTQLQQCTDDIEVEELIESLHRTDAL
jgi:hypothetical protein